MAEKKVPLVSIGIPVFQGENFVDQALRAARAQDYQNLEIVVSDNASTDATLSIIQAHSAEDPRVQYIVQLSNVGAAGNYNNVFRQSRGDYFIWNAHDDYFSPDFISAGVAALEADEAAVVALARPFRVDPAGVKLEELEVPPALYLDSVATRFRAAARSVPDALVFGLFRREALEASGLHGRFTGSDRNFVAEMALHGRAVSAGGSEFYLREHESRSIRRFDQTTDRFGHPREAWFDPGRAGKIVFPNWRRFGAYISAVARAPIPFPDRLACYLAVARLLVDDNLRLSKGLLGDVVGGAIQVVRRIENSIGGWLSDRKPRGG